jgi:hypothetical protein
MDQKIWWQNQVIGEQHNWSQLKDALWVCDQLFR